MREKKLTFERIYNYGGVDCARDYLLKNEGLRTFLVDKYKSDLREFTGKSLGEMASNYYNAVKEKVKFLEEKV